MQNKILKVQIQKIKMAQKQLGIDDETYRDLLAEFYNAKSCTELSQKHADLFLENLKKHGWKEKPVNKKKKYSEFNDRMGYRATGAQMRMIEAMWMETAREKTEAALNKFIKRITKKSHITFITKTDVKNLKQAIENFK